MLNIIASIGQNGELGKNNNLIWPLKKDLKYFKEMTWNHDIIMGRKTFESLPKLLEHRNHIILSRSNIDIEGVKVYNNIEVLLMDYKDKDAFIIGGASIYKALLDFSDNLYLTLIEKSDAKADTYFPQIEKKDFKKIYIDEDIEDGILFKHVLYKRR